MEKYLYSIFIVYRDGEYSKILNLEEEFFFEKILEYIFEYIDYDDDEDSHEDDSDNQKDDNITKDSDINVVAKYLEDLYDNSSSEYVGVYYECFKHVDNKLVSNLFNTEFWLKLATYYKENMFKKLKEWFCKEDNSFLQSIIEKESVWRDIEVEKPPFEVVLGALDTYDCGWTIETTWWNEKEECWMGNDANGMAVESQLHYSHWRLLPPPPNLDI